MSEISFESVLESFPNPVWVSGAKGETLFFNRAWREFTGRSLDRIKDRWKELVHKEDSKRCIRTFQEHLNKKAGYKMEYRLICGKGDYRWVMDCSAPYIDDKGRFRGLVGSCYDIHDLKVQEKEIEERNRQLEHFNKLVVERELRMVELKKEIRQQKSTGSDIPPRF